MTETIVYTLIGILLYFLSDKILRYLEGRAGRPFDDRNLIFFGIIMVLAVSSFTFLRLVLPAN